jgi:hypothetical protein
LLDDVGTSAARADDGDRGAVQPSEAVAEETHAAALVHGVTRITPKRSGTTTTLTFVNARNTERTQRASVSLKTIAPYGVTREFGLYSTLRA